MAAQSVSPGPNTDSPLISYTKLLLRLHCLIAEGKGDSEEADELRDIMDKPWYRLAPDELNIVRQLSADLYTLNDDPLVRHPQDWTIYTPELAADLSAAVQHHEYLRALRLMQERPNEIAFDRATIFRAILYKLLGLPAIGLLFFEHVAIPETSDPTSLPWLGFLWRHLDLEAAAVDACAGNFADTPA